MSDEAVYYRIGTGDYAVSINIDTAKPLEVFHVGNLQISDGIHVVNQDELSKLGMLTPPSKGKYTLLSKGKILAFEKLQGGIRLSQTLRNEVFEERTVRVAEQFRRRMWGKLIDCVYSKNTGVEEVLNQLITHTFSDHYSLWLYNEHTQHFHLHCASFPSDAQYVPADNVDATLREMLDEKNQYIHRAIKSEQINSNRLKDMVWINRYRIEKGAGLIAVVSFYSRHDSFSFAERISQIIPEIISSKLEREFSPYLDKHLQVRTLVENYSPGNLKSFLSSNLPKLTSLIGWESTSVFLFDAEIGSLTLSALAINGTEVECPKASYDLSTSSLTGSVYLDSKLAFSYDISNDPRNSHGFDESTNLNPVNWVGVPIVRPTESPVGVLRVRNKLSANGEIVHFNVFDIDLLQNIASIIAYLCHIEGTFRGREQAIQADLSKQEAENEQLSEYIKTFRHELKSPLTVVTQASNTIRRALAQSGICDEELLPKKVKDILSDLDMVGSRLVYVTSVLTFEAQELVKDIEVTGLFHDIVAPVLAFSIPYAKNRGRTLKVDKDSLFNNVYCDSQAASMVFHMLIDNAIKYSKPNTTITIRGGASETLCSIYIESYGLPILPEEKEYIFRRYFRGAHAKQQKTDGSGIGLYLAREIMKHNRGEVMLKRLSSPTLFVLSIERAGKENK
ncbi:MAG: ATP-binding protein [Sideroxydans sp.]|nr:ATP-binding protein [Sideroxydans sp.]